MSPPPDLSKSITMHPHPFHSHHDLETQSTSPHTTTTALEPATPSSKTNPQRDSTPRRTVSEAYSSGRRDIEERTVSCYTVENDPYDLSAKIKSQSELSAIRANTSRKRDGCGPIMLNKEAHRARKLEKFYEGQNENIRRLLKPVEEHVERAKEIDGDNQLKLKIAVNGSFVANIILAILQLYAASTSGSLSLVTTLADAIFDPFSNFTLMYTRRKIKKVDPRRYPSGKARIETAGNILFCFLMAAVSFVIIVVSVLEIVRGNGGSQTKPFHMTSIIVVSVAFFTKLGLFFYCWALRNIYSQVRILWEDHRNDLFINGIGVLTSLGGSKLKWWIDPMGAILLSLLIAILWIRTAQSEFQLLIGVTADTEMQQWITYISMTHSPMILAIDTVRAYHSGPRIIVEVDIVMDPHESLRTTHDVAEDLQMKLESLPDVERAYVHIDYETSHKPEHFYKKGV
ncbi:MAG: hypothetical protein MMC33_003364 [Icmadophila ericetorum]|nr:hypothetical protein [Icmadophila ericetorum]